MFRPLFANAYGLIMSRAVARLRDKEPFFGIIPGIDLLNHSSVENCEIYFDRNSSCWEATTVKDVEKDSQLFINYGQMSLFRELRLYGTKLT